MSKQLISERFTLIGPDLKRIAVGAGVAAVAAFVTFVAEHIQGIDFGTYTPFVMVVVSVIVNAIRKWIAETKY